MSGQNRQISRSKIMMVQNFIIYSNTSPPRYLMRFRFRAKNIHSGYLAHRFPAAYPKGFCMNNSSSRCFFEMPNADDDQPLWIYVNCLNRYEESSSIPTNDLYNNSVHCIILHHHHSAWIANLFAMIDFINEYRLQGYQMTITVEERARSQRVQATGEKCQRESMKWKF